MSTYTTSWEGLSRNRQGECADGDQNCGLHLDRFSHEEILQELLGVFVRAGSLEIVVCDCGRKSEEELESGSRLKWVGSALW
jgi:hypothetical protein